MPTPVKKRKNSKSIGNAWEREVVKILEHWTGLAFRRSFGSGAFKGSYEKSHELGDVRPKDPKDFVTFPFLVECKKIKHFPYNMVLGEKCGLLQEWMAQSLSDFYKARDTMPREEVLAPMLIFKSNLVEPWVGVCFDNEGRDALMPYFDKVLGYDGWMFLALNNLTRKQYRGFLRLVVQNAME